MLGGKLVQVELSVREQCLRDVRITGDFFINPEAASTTTLQSLCQALEGVPVDLPQAAIQSRLQAALPYPVTLLGTTTEALAVAVRRAITGQAASGTATPLERVGSFSEADIQRLVQAWQGQSWTIFPEVPLSAAMNVALDEVLTNQVGQGSRGPTLRFWRWSEPAVIIGRTQSVLNEVDQVAAQSKGVRVVRRLTGGGAMFLQPHGAITYSLYLPERLVSGLTIRQSYEVCDAWVTFGLRELGCQAYYVPINDIACSEGKIGGAAQARRSGVVLHHTTLAYDMDPGEMLQVLRIGREKLSGKGTSSAAKRVSPLVRQTGLSREAIVERLLHSFQRRFGGELAELGAVELAEAEQLCQSRYLSEEWINEFA